MLLLPPISTLFPYTTLFRSNSRARHRNRDRSDRDQACGFSASQAENGQPIGRHERMRSSNLDRKSTRLNSSHLGISYAVFCLKKKNKNKKNNKKHTTSTKAE